MNTRPMRRFFHAVLVMSLLLALAAPPTLAQDDEPSADLKALDLLFFRPVRLVTFVVGTAAFIATMPIPFLFGDHATIDEARDRAFTEPASALFETPLGDL